MLNLSDPALSSFLVPSVSFLMQVMRWTYDLRTASCRSGVIPGSSKLGVEVVMGPSDGAADADADVEDDVDAEAAAAGASEVDSIRDAEALTFSFFTRGSARQPHTSVASPIETHCAPPSSC